MVSLVRLPLVLAAVLSLTLAVPAVALAKSKRARTQEKTSSPAPVTKAGLPNIQAESAYIVDLDTGEELYSKNPDQVRAIASVGKLFLALAVRGKKVPLDGVTVIQEE